MTEWRDRITKRTRSCDADIIKNGRLSVEGVSRPHGASMQGERHLISGVTAGETAPETQAKFVERRARQMSPMGWQAYDDAKKGVSITSRNHEIAWISSLERAEDEWLAKNPPLTAKD